MSTTMVVAMQLLAQSYRFRSARGVGAIIERPYLLVVLICSSLIFFPDYVLNYLSESFDWELSWWHLGISVAAGLLLMVIGLAAFALAGFAVEPGFCVILLGIIGVIRVVRSIFSAMLGGEE